MTHWFVVCCNVKAEVTAERELRAAGFDAYLPQFKVERFNRKLRKAIITEQVLFPRYLFVRMNREDIRKVMACKGVADMLPGFPHQPEPVRLIKPRPDAEAIDPVERLRQAQANLELDDTDAARKRRGETSKNSLAALRKRLRDKRVTITDGPFARVPGTVEVVHSFTRLQVLVDIFGRPTPVELEIGQIEEAA